MKIKTLILLMINGLIALVVIVLSLSFYKQFSSVLDERILLQLNSIKTLKKNQIESLIKSEWKNFSESKTDFNTIDTLAFKIPFSLKNKNGIFDFTPYHIHKKTSIGLLKTDNSKLQVKIIDYDKIKNILLERTGMGNSGESYIVGDDFYMRSQSRFFLDKNPFSIKVETQGVANALKGADGKGIFKDYRSVYVYSSYSLISTSSLKLVILSEIDVSEVIEPLNKLKIRLVFLSIVILSLAVILSLVLTKLIANPIKNMQKSLKVMAEGNYNDNHNFSKNSYEIKQMFEALESLKASLQGAVKFSEEIGKMNLDAHYQPKSNYDILGKSLILMRNKLNEFRNKEQVNRILAKKMLVDGLENERQRLSRELHDGISPYLTSLKYFIENKVADEKEKLEMKHIIDNTIAEIRLMSNSLMPSIIYDFGVGVAVKNFVNNLANTTNSKLIFEDLTNKEDSKITNQQAINLFRICQELINNGLKHAKANTIRISISELNEFISLYYFDDGIGFDINKVQLGSGIINIKERVEICNGTIIINSNKGNTIFEIELPIEL